MIYSDFKENKKEVKNDNINKNERYICIVADLETLFASKQDLIFLKDDLDVQLFHFVCVRNACRETNI